MIVVDASAMIEVLLNTSTGVQLAECRSSLALRSSSKIGRPIYSSPPWETTMTSNRCSEAEGIADIEVSLPAQCRSHDRDGGNRRVTFRFVDSNADLVHEERRDSIRLISAGRASPIQRRKYEEGLDAS